YGENADDITEIAINRPNEVWVEKSGEWICLEIPEMTYEKCQAAGVAAAKFSNNDFAEVMPILSTVLPNKERAQFVMPPACEENTISLTIRKPSKGIIPLKVYHDSGFFNRVIPVSDEISPADKRLKELLAQKKYEEFLIEAVLAEKNIIVAGATGSGKTTFMKALMQKIPKEDRIITIEDVAELFLPEHPNHVHLFYPCLLYTS
ncbi:ATPase, T2SS/T4P/T4SS family, partial [Kingella kingae]|uniref:ATPase, T2SS/T4P/T4SS family n=1 Tax=Kingella kingae TaxID=504 RepID=UPI002549EAEE